MTLILSHRKAVAVIMAAGLTVFAAGANAQIATKPAVEPSTAPAAKVLATVGKHVITSDQVDRILNAASQMDPIPADRLAEVRADICGFLVTQRLYRAYMADKKVEAADADVQSVKEKIEKMAASAKMKPETFMLAQGLDEQSISDRVRLDKLINDRLSAEKVTAFIAANPQYFAGSTFQASHILVKCDVFASTQKQKAAKAKLEQIAADIKAGKTTFEKAAIAHSDCPSSEKGGDLGEFAFDRMVPAFSIAVADGKLNEVTGIVQSRFGFHIIKPTAKKEGKALDEATKVKVARGIISANLEAEVMSQPTNGLVVVIVDEKADEPRATQPATDSAK